MRILILLFVLVIVLGCQDSIKEGTVLIGEGEMPNVVKDKMGRIHVVYGEGDQIMYVMSDDQGNSYPVPDLVTTVPEVAASHMRGPQITATANGLLITACTHDGDIYSFIRDSTGKWIKTARINDVDTVAKENLMALSADGRFAFAVWLDLRDGHNKLVGSASADGGRTWGKNVLVYASPDTTVCECCKPSVLVKENRVVVMFRNLLKGNRDMYLVESTDGGQGFGQAVKLGTGSWKLDGCPMDGGGFVLNAQGNPEAVWRREKNIYVGSVNKETSIGQGKGCTIESANGKNVFAWVEHGSVVLFKPDGKKEIVGEGSMPTLKAVDDGKVICIWENEHKIHSRVIELLEKENHR